MIKMLTWSSAMCVRALGESSSVQRANRHDITSSMGSSARGKHRNSMLMPGTTSERPLHAWRGPVQMSEWVTKITYPREGAICLSPGHLCFWPEQKSLQKLWGEHSCPPRGLQPNRSLCCWATEPPRAGQTPRSFGNEAVLCLWSQECRKPPLVNTPLRLTVLLGNNWSRTHTQACISDSLTN